MDLKGKSALVTGGSAGIGKAVARKLGLEGASVAICGRTRETLLETEKELRSEGVSVAGFPCDVSDLDQVEGMVNELIAGSGSVDVLVNNAGALEDTPMSPLNDEGWSTVLRTNLDGVYFVTSRILPHMRDGGSVVNIASVLGKIGVPGAAAYCASKHGVIGFTRSIALELASRRISVNAICPGWVDTELAKVVMERAAKSVGVSYEEFRQNALGQVPLGEMIQPEEIASLVCFLASSAGSSITGQSYSICGGQVMH